MKKLKFEEIILVIFICFVVIWGNVRLIHDSIVHHQYYGLLYYPIAYLLACIPGYAFKKEFKYEEWWVKILSRICLVIIFGGIFTFA